MTRAAGTLVLAPISVVVAACLSVPPPDLSLGIASCSGTDTSCMQSAFYIEDSSNQRIELTTIPAGTIQASQIQPGKGAPTVTDYYSTTLTFVSWDECLLATLTFSDPNGARIGGCFHIRPLTQLPGSFGTYPMVAAASVPDGQTTGTFSIWICPGFIPIDGGADFAIDMFPIAPVTPGEEAVAQLLAGAPVAVGNPLSFEAHVASTDSGGSSGSSGSGGSSGGSSGCAAGDLLVSTLSCTPLGTAGVSSYCLSSSEYTAAAGAPLPSACTPSGMTACLGTTGTLVAPCCPGLTCRVSAMCGDSSNAAGGTCLP